MKTLEDEE